jgi:hypothetical protein
MRGKLGTFLPGTEEIYPGKLEKFFHLILGVLFELNFTQPHAPQTRGCS